MPNVSDHLLRHVSAENSIAHAGERAADQPHATYLVEADLGLSCNPPQSLKVGQHRTNWLPKHMDLVFLCLALFIKQVITGRFSTGQMEYRAQGTISGRKFEGQLTLTTLHFSTFVNRYLCFELVTFGCRS